MQIRESPPDGMSGTIDGEGIDVAAAEADLNEESAVRGEALKPAADAAFRWERGGAQG